MLTDQYSFKNMNTFLIVSFVFHIIFYKLAVKKHEPLIEIVLIKILVMGINKSTVLV